jgi:hypothetical protein
MSVNSLRKSTICLNSFGVGNVFFSWWEVWGDLKDCGRGSRREGLSRDRLRLCSLWFYDTVLSRVSRRAECWAVSTCPPVLMYFDYVSVGANEV